MGCNGSKCIYHRVIIIYKALGLPCAEVLMATYSYIFSGDPIYENAVNAQTAKNMQLLIPVLTRAITLAYYRSI